MFSKGRAVITFHQCQSATVHCFGIQRSWPVSLASSLEILLIYLKFSEVSSLCCIPPLFPFLYWLNADFNMWGHTVWPQTSYFVFVAQGQLKQRKSSDLEWKITSCIWPYSCLFWTDLMNIIMYFRIFHMVRKNRLAYLKFKKIQYNLMGFLIVILFFVFPCAVGNLVTLHLKLEMCCIFSMSLEIIIIFTCPGPESTLGSKVCCSNRSKD